MGIKKADFKTPPTDGIRKATKKESSEPSRPRTKRQPVRQETGYALKGTFRVGAGKVVTAGKARKKMTVSFDPNFIHGLRGRLNHLQFEQGIGTSISDVLMVAAAYFFDELPTDEQVQLIEEASKRSQ